MSAPPILKPGKIGDQKVQMFMDSGADASIISRQLLPDNFIQCTPVNVTGVNSHDRPKLCQTAIFPAEIEGHQFQMFAAVTDEELPHQCIVGRSIPGLNLTWDIKISQPGYMEQNGEVGERASQVVQGKTFDPSASPQQPPEPAEQQGNQHLQPALTKGSLPPPQSMETVDLENLTPLDIAMVRTRAQSMREQQGQQRDDAATAATGAPITNPDTIPALVPTNSEDRPDEAGQMPTLTTTAPPQDTTNLEDPTVTLVDSSTVIQTKAPTRTGQPQQPQHQPDYTIVNAPFTSEDLKREQQADPDPKKLWDLAKDPLPTEYISKNGILYWINQAPQSLDNPHKIVVPRSLKAKVLHLAHACSGHFGAKKTKAHIQGHFTWPGLSKDVTDHCRACTTCASVNTHRKQIQPLQPVPIVHQPWDKLAIDVVGPFERTTAGYKYILTIVDMATRFPEAIPLKRVDTASTAEALLQVFSAYGTPSTIVHDNGGNFTSDLMTSTLKALNISQIRVAPYHPEANGMIERLNGTLKHAIMKAGATRSTWDKWLHFVLHAV